MFNRKMPLKAPIAFFDNSLSYASSGDEELIELTANFDDEEDEGGEDSSAFQFDNDSLDKDEIDERRQQKSNCGLYEVRGEVLTLFSSSQSLSASGCGSRGGDNGG